MPKRARKQPGYLDDYILQKITRRTDKCDLNIVKEHRQNMENLINNFDDLNLNSDKPSADVLIEELENMSINDKVNAMDKKVTDMDNVFEFTSKKPRIGGQKGGFVVGMNATALIMYLIKDAIKQGAIDTYEQLRKLLVLGLNVLEFLSNKDGCAELVIREMLGRQVMIVLQFFLLGQMVTAIDPMKIITILADLLPKLLPYVTKGISAGFFSAIGYLVYHFVNHYGTKLSNNAKGKVESLKNTLDALEEATSKDVVETIISKSQDMVEKTNELITELNKETPVHTEEEGKEFMEHIKNSLTAIPEVRQGEFDDTMTIEELRASLENTEPEQTGTEGGKKHKKRKTQKRKNKSNKKTTKKSNKSKKHRK